jgi:L-lactate dehydrogenase (cytochrome)
MPVGIAPVGLTGLNWADGEILGARAAAKFGVPFTLSTMSICSIEDVAGAVQKPFWFQLYVFRDRGFAASLIERAKAAKCSALVLTLDLQIQGQRHMDIKNGLTVPPQLKLANLVDMLCKPFLGLQRHAEQAKVVRQPRRPDQGRRQPAHALAMDRGQFDPTLSWKDIEWVRSYGAAS